MHQRLLRAPSTTQGKLRLLILVDAVVHLPKPSLSRPVNAPKALESTKYDTGKLRLLILIGHVRHLLKVYRGGLGLSDV
jgi:hypothetical protein